MNQLTMTHEEALRRLKLTKQRKQERIEVLRKRAAELYKARTGSEPKEIVFV